MRRLFTTADSGLTRAALRWGEERGRWRTAGRGVWAEGPEDVGEVDCARAVVLVTHGVASHHLAAVLLGLDSVRLDGNWVTLPPGASGRRERVVRRKLEPERITTVMGLRCTDGAHTMVDLASSLTDAVWELMVQLIRTVPGLPEPVRPLWIEETRARLDLAWPELGLFLELDGQHHLDQPVYDARCETAVVAARGWLCGRFTWTEVVHVPNSTARRLDAPAEQARRRPVQPRSSSAMPV